MTSPSLQKSNELYRLTHEKYPDNFAGFSMMEYVYDIGKLIQHSNITTCLDYGCGKARAWKQYNLATLWKLQHVDLYDPGVEQYAVKPSRTSDLVLCMDVMEHVPEGCVDEVLADINSLAKKAIFFNICVRPASKTLVDGSNAHATVKPQQWWREKLNKIDKLVIVHFSK